MGFFMRGFWWRAGGLLLVGLWMFGYFTPVLRAQEKRPFRERAMWVVPRDLGHSEESVRAFVEKCKRAHIDLLVLLVKGSGGRIFWHSQKFSEAIHPDWRDFDVLAALVKVAHEEGLRVHAWLCDFPEGEDSPAYKKHPEWAMINPEGQTTLSERLGSGRPYRYVWMCPVRRPGYADQWLLPMMEELVTNYAIDGIHHDYIRYPGDVAPDSYCFCDYCLEAYLKYNHFYYEVYPDSVFVPRPILPRPEANWWKDYTVRPREWDRWTRQQKAHFILHGSSMPNGPSDLDYFFYEFRADAITQFVRESTERLRKIRPDIEISAAVFKNPMLSGRNIGQRWTDFAPWVDILMPMTYRSHFPGSFETFLNLLTEYTRYQRKWAAGRSRVYTGITAHYLYMEEYGPIDSLLTRLTGLKEGQRKPGKGEIKALWYHFGKIRSHLARVAPGWEEKIKSYLSRIEESHFEPEAVDSLRTWLQRLKGDPPPGYYPEEKLIRAIEAVRRGGAEGIVIFASSHVEGKKLWGALEKAFSP